MSILSLVQENLKKRNKISNFDNEKHIQSLNSLFSKNKEDILKLNNVVEAATLIKLAPAWDLINNFDVFKSLGLNTIEEMQLYQLIQSKTNIDNEGDKKWLISIISEIIDFPPYDVDKIDLNHLKLFSSIFIEGEENKERNEKLYLPEFLSNEHLSSFTNEELFEILNLVKECNSELAQGRHLFTFVMDRMNSSNVIFLLKQYLEEETDYNEIELDSFEALFYLNKMNVQDIDLKNLKTKSKLLKEHYLTSRDFEDETLLKPFIHYFKEGNDLTTLNEDFLFNLNKAKEHALIKGILSNHIKSKNFQKNMKEFLEPLTNHDVNSLGLFYHYWFVDEDNKKYQKLINVNQLSLDEINYLMHKRNLSRSYNQNESLESIMNYLEEIKSMNEIKNLTNKEVIMHIDKKDVKFSTFIFDNFKNEKVDTRITLFKFLNSINLNKNLNNQEFMDKFTSKIKKLKNPINLIHFYKEFEGKQVDKETAFVLYILKDSFIEKLINEAVTEQDFVFILKNRNELNYSISLLENKKEFILNSELIKTYFEKVSISNEFKMKYFENILDFYQKGNVDSTIGYINNVSSEKQVKNIGLLVKAELAGKLNDIKYNREDLRKELASNISDEMIDKWTTELSKTNKKITVKESSDFKTLFEMGENPTRSCMSYASGAYNECLLSIFDGNKKLVTVYEDDKLIGRAILRLTKITDKQVLTQESSHLEFGFRDIETDGYIELVDDNSEKTVLFLERLYTSYTGNQLDVITNMMFDLVKEKSKEMGLSLYVSNGYNNIPGKTEKVETNMFISHSKNGKQYLDSLGGSANSSVGGTYKKAKITRLI